MNNFLLAKTVSVSGRCGHNLGRTDAQLTTYDFTETELPEMVPKRKYPHTHIKYWPGTSVNDVRTLIIFSSSHASVYVDTRIFDFFTPILNLLLLK